MNERGTLKALAMAVATHPDAEPLSTDDLVLEGIPSAHELFAGRYRIERVLGVGGMGVVLAAFDEHAPEPNTRVAIKFLLPELANDRDTLSRFLKEGRAVIRMKSEHVARVFEVAETTPEAARKATKHAKPYIVMEYLDGSDLDEVLEARGTLSVEEAVDYVLQACDAIAEAHANQIVHRDLKPSNLFLASTRHGPRVKVLDFGISKMERADSSMTMTKTSTVMGSPLYMSPEQLRSAKHLDHRADIWAIGVILYELLSGKPPFVAETIAELGALVLSGQAPWLGDVRPDVPPGLAAIVATCLRREAADRFTNLADFADAIAVYGPASARADAARIIATLGGVPSQRASLASRASLTRTLASPPSDTGHHGVAFAQTVPSDPAIATSSRGSAAAEARGEPRPTHASNRRGTLVVVSSLIGVALVAGFIGAVSWRGRSAPAVDARAAAPITSMPSIDTAPSASLASPSAPSSTSEATVVSSADKPPSRSPPSSSTARTPTRRTQPPATPPKTATTPTAPATSAAKSDPNGMAKSAKD